MNLHQPRLWLEDVIINSELLSRPPRVPDYKAENQALLALVQTLADAPDKILQTLVETAVQLCRADTAGISLLEQQGSGEVIRWEMLAGVFSDRLNATMPREASPCGTAIDRNAAQLMYMAARVLPALKSEPPLVEILVVPFHVERKPIGTVWVAAHDERRKFDREDERVIKTLAQFASASWPLWQVRASTAAEARDKLPVLDLAAANAASQAHSEHETAADEKLQQLNIELQVRTADAQGKLTKAKADIDTLAAAIAHDFNNVLSVIQAYATLIMSSSTEPNSVVEHAEVIRATVEEGRALTRQLVNAGRKTRAKLDLTDINDLLQRTTKSLAPMFPATTVIAVDLDPRAPMIMIDAGLIYQAILNLCINARDAMPDGGKILVQTRMSSGAALRPRFGEAMAEQYVYIAVADTGVGMKAEVRSRVFESYFTTKKADQGTGLGLSIVHGIVTDHEGFIEVTSEPDRGSTFHIYLPVPKEEAIADQIITRSAQSRIEDGPRDRKTVLYAEDNARLSGLMQRLLEKEGYNVLTAQDGAEAVGLHRRYNDLIDIAILDFGLAKLNGLEAFRMMKKVNPQLKGILASGYVSAEAESRLAKGELSGVLQKPYAEEEILATIERAMQS